MPAVSNLKLQEMKNLGTFITYRISLSLEIIATPKLSHES
jgi:hypothetical protein